MFNDDQKSYMRYLATMAPETKCWSGWCSLVKIDSSSISLFSGDIPIYISEFYPANNDDGSPRLYTFVRDARLGGPYVLVHPSRKDAFYAAMDCATEAP